MDAGLEEILKRMGWTTGLHLPNANEENKALQNEIERLMIQKAKAMQLFEAEDTRYNSISNHLKFVKKQNEENQNLLATYRQHLDSQSHKFLLTQSENDRVRQEIRQMEKQMQETEARNYSKKGDLTRGIARMNKIKSETSWDNEALKAWEESLKKRNDDNELLKRFSQEDQRKANELEAKRKICQVEAIKRKETLDKTVGDVFGYEQILERTGKIFKQQREERAALTKQWQEAASNLRRRDDELDKMIQEIIEAQALSQQEQERLDEQNCFYLNEIKNNKEVEMAIELLNVEGSRIREKLNDLIQYVLTLHSEANTLKRDVVASANFLEKERTKSKSLSMEIGDKEHKIELMEKELNNLTSKLNEVKNSSMSAADRAQQLEQIIQFEQRQTGVLASDIERMQGVVYRTQQVMNELKDDGKLQEMTISGCDTSINLFKKTLKDLANQLQKQKEINYDLDYVINDMEIRLDKLEGQTVDEGKQVLEEKIINLENDFANENDMKRLLEIQVTHIEEEMRRLSMAITHDNKQLSVLQDKLQDEVLSFEGGMKQSVVAKQSSQRKQVDENMLRLNVNQLENIMKREDNSIFNLQKYRCEIETAMREREIEIITNRDILAAKRRNMEEEKSRLKKDITTRQIKIEQLQKRFHIVIMALGKGDDGEPLSVTHFKIKNAQEKFMLQQEGDALDAKVRKTEQEIVAMENTLKLVNTSNVTYRNSLSAVEEYDLEAQEMQQLKDALDEVSNEIRVKRKDLVEKKAQVAELRQILQEADEENSNAKQALATLENEYSDLERYQIEQHSKIDRADRHLHTCMKNVDLRMSQKYHRNLIIRSLQDSNKSALQKLAEAATRYQDITPHINKYMLEHELQLPGPRTTFTPSTSSACSSRSSFYYERGPYISNVLLTFDTVPDYRKNQKTSTKKIKGKRADLNIYNKYQDMK